MKRAGVMLALYLGCSPAAPVARVVEHQVVVPPKPPARLGEFEVMHLPTGADITPHAAPGSLVMELDPHVTEHPEMRAGYAVSLALSPDGTTLALLTSGYNQLETEKGVPVEGTRAEYIFFYDVSKGAPAEKQVVTLPNAFVGLAFGTDGLVYASGGPDDAVVVVERHDGLWGVTRMIKLGHKNGLGVGQGPLAAGIAVSADGARVVVANHENDTLSVIDARTASVTEIALRPGNGVAGGEFPMGVAIVGTMAYVAAQRDREIVEVDLDAKKVTRRAQTGGQPVRVVARRDGTKLYVANANTDDVAIVDRAHFTVDSRVMVGGPKGSLAASLRGASPNAVVLSPDEKSLYVSLGGANAIAIVSLDHGELAALVPTGFYPNDVAVSRDGSMIYCAYGKSPTGANPKGPWFDDARVHEKPFQSAGGNQFSLQLHHGGLHAFPKPRDEIAALLTARAIENEHVASAPVVPPIFAALHGKVKRVVYVIAENRTFDQILGDVPGLDGDAKLVHWNASITPNQHALATTFVGFDRFFDSGGVSGDGWQWSTAARATDVAEKEIPLMYAGRGAHTYDWEGKNRGVNVSVETTAQRRVENPTTPDDDDLMPGSADVAAPDRPREGGTGYLWDAAKAAGLRVRNYGFFIDDARYGLPKSNAAAIGPLREPFKTKTRVAYATALGLAADTDPYFRGYDATFSDFWREREWQRELAEFDQKGDMPELVLVRLPHDHIGAFAKSLDGVDTPDTQIADHDYALGLMVEALSRSKLWKDTVLFALEDDAQDGADHVDAHRSVLFMAGAHVKRGAVSHATYTTPSVLRTIELLLGLQPLGRRDAVAPPIADALTESLDETAFVAAVPDVLRSTKLPLPPPKKNEHATAPRGDATSWERATAGMRFDREDVAPAAALNAALYCGLIASPSCAKR
jgi:DNA-binding beta-propeller fold protein YncE